MLNMKFVSENSCTVAAAKPTGSQNIILTFWQENEQVIVELKPEQANSLQDQIYKSLNLPANG